MSMMGGSMMGLFGGILGGVGASQTAKDTNEAGMAARQDLLDQLYWGMLQQKKAELGSAGARQWYEANVPQDQKDRLFGTADFQETNVATVDPRDPNLRGRGPFTGINALAFTPEQRQAQMFNDPSKARPTTRTVKGLKGKFNADAFFGDDTPGYLSQMEGLQKRYGAMGMQALNQSRGIEEQARSYGAGERARIERDAERGLKEANRAGSASLAAAGLGGTSLGASMNQGNASSMYRAKSDALGMLDDRTLQFLTGLRQNTLGLGLSNQNRDLNLAQAPIAARMQLSSSAAFNPFLNRDTTQYYPGMSPMGSMLTSFGNSLSGAGGQMSGQGFQMDYLKQAGAMGAFK